jgi:hypothetical protein
MYCIEPIPIQKNFNKCAEAIMMVTESPKFDVRNHRDYVVLLFTQHRILFIFFVTTFTGLLEHFSCTGRVVYASSY